MSLLGFIIVFTAVIVTAVLIAFVGRLLYVRQVRRSLVKLLGRREAVVAAVNGVDRVLEHLLSADDATLGAFASDPASEDRRALEDVAARMAISADDLRSLALPKRLWPVAERMEATSREIALQAGAVGEAANADAVLDALAAIRVPQIRSGIEAADSALQPLLETFKVSDPAVYGGGLYI